LETARVKLVEAAKAEGIELKQTYAKEGQLLSYKAGRYAHARQFKRMRKAIQRQSTIVGRLHREISRMMTTLSQAVQDDLIVGARAFHGNPYDYHTLNEQVEQATILMQALGTKPQTAFFCACYRPAVWVTLVVNCERYLSTNRPSPVQCVWRWRENEFFRHDQLHDTQIPFSFPDHHLDGRFV
jgi:hypothetical protein